MNLLEMRTYIRRVLNEEGESDGYYADAELTEYINESYKELVRIFPSQGIGDIYELVDSETYSTTTGSETLPSNFDRWLSVKYGSYYCTLLNYINDTAINDNSWYVAATVQPNAYLSGTTLKVLPTPSVATAVILTYISTPTALSADTDTPAIKDIFHEMICFGALERANRKDNELEEGAYHFTRMKEKLYRYYGLLTPEEQLRK